MKKYVFIITVLLWVNISVSAQYDYRKHQIEAGVGIWNTNELVNTFSDMIISSLREGGVTMQDDMSYASWHAAYRYYFSKRLALGALFAYDHAKSNALREGVEIGNLLKRHATVALEAEFGYLRTDFISLYGLAGFGGTRYGLEYKPSGTTSNGFEAKSEAEYYFNYQLTPIGIRLGSTFGFFAELGFGYRGILNAGLFAQF
jgi:hypothetical protein